MKVPEWSESFLLWQGLFNVLCTSHLDFFRSFDMSLFFFFKECSSMNFLFAFLFSAFSLGVYLEKNYA